MTNAEMRYVCGECGHDRVGVWAEHQAHYERHALPAELAFWRDLADDMCVPVFRAGFERTWAELHGWSVEATAHYPLRTQADWDLLGRELDDMKRRLGE